MSGEHSILPPSGAKAWKACALWPTMNERYPQDDTPESKEGTAAHWVFAEMLARRTVAEGMSAPNGVFVTDEMIEGGELVVETVRNRTSSHDVLHVEEAVEIPRVSPLCWGTPDIWSFSEPQMTLELFDYKFGHRFVDEIYNEQGIAYTAGILELIAKALRRGVGEIDSLITVNFTIIQPRCFYKGNLVRTWSIKAVDLRGNVNQLYNAASQATNVLLGSTRRAVTNSECIDCPGRHACVALQKAAYSDAEFAVTGSPVELSSEAASLELMMMERSLDRLQSRVEGLREAVTAHIRQGRNVPWHRAEQGFGRQTWTLPVEQVLAMGSLMGVDLSKSGVKTPKQAQSLGIDEAVIKAYSITPMSSIKLVPNNPSDARRVFGSTK